MSDSQFGNVDLTIWQKWSLQKWKSKLGEILKHLAFQKGTPNIDIHELSLYRKQMAKLLHKIQSPGSH